MGIENSQIRRIVLNEHDGLRKRLDEIEADLVKLTDDQTQGFQNLRTAFQSLLEAFVHHIDHEEALLKPILRDLDAWGPVRLEQMEKEHHDQRAHVTELLSLDPGTSISHWVSEMRSFASRLREDMLGEEHDFLHPNVLRDDIISVDLLSS